MTKTSVLDIDKLFKYSSPKYSQVTKIWAVDTVNVQQRRPLYSHGALVKGVGLNLACIVFL